MARVLSTSILAASLAALPLPAAGAAAPPPEPPRRVVLVSFDGAGGAEYERQREALTPDGFRRAEREGVWAERLQVVTPSLTAVVHASISTGALPERTGIVSNTYRPAGEPLKTRANGFDAEPAVETLWEAVARQGHRVAALCWPGVTGRTPRATTPVGVRWTDLRTPGFLWHGPAAGTAFPDAAIALPPELQSWSPPRLVRVEAPAGRTSVAARPLAFVLLDTVDDGRREYDTLAALDADGRLAGRLRAGDWLALDEKGEGVARRGRWVKLLRLSPDASALSLYVGGIAQTEAWPEDFQRTLDRRCGFWPGPPDDDLLKGPEPDVKTFLEMAGRLSEFLTSVYAVAERRGDWDLLLAYQPVVDEVGHELTPPAPDAPKADAVRAAHGAAGVRESWRIADRAAARYLRFRELGGDVVVVSDHGLRPVRREVFPADVLVCGGSAFVVLNRAGAMPGGVLSPEEAAGVLADIAGAFRALKDETGAPLFEVVALRGEASTLGLDHPNTGDLVLLAGHGTWLRPGFPKQGEAAPLLLPTELSAQHGYGPDPELDGLFFHVGDGLAPARHPSVRAVDVAARVTTRLGLSPPGAK